MTGLAPGTLVWAALLAALVTWLAATTASRRLPSLVDLVHWLLDAWLGRLLLLACWAELGFHLLTQRP